MSDSRTIIVLGGNTRTLNPEVFYIKARRCVEPSGVAIQTKENRYPQAKKKKNAHLTVRKG